MKIGFSILSHKKNDQVFESLMRQLDVYPDKEIAIHHDFSKAPFDANKIKSISFDLVKESVETQWSHVNNIEAILKTFELLYDKKCDWFVTLSANCYPIKKSIEFIRFLEASVYDGYIERNNVNTDFFDFYTYFRKGFQTKYLFSIPFLRKNGTFYFKAIRKKRNPEENIFQSSMIPYHGSDWFMINRKAMEYILNNREKIRVMTDFLRDVNRGPDINVCPAEIVFQTLLGNNPAFKLNNYNYRYINWENAVNWHPNVLDETYWEAIKQTDAFYTRKVDAQHSLPLITLIDTKLLNG